MVKKVKNRDRRDQYYRLARESGYRSRAAFKLLQLDSKIGFLSTARCVVDLCAAPGGWLQAASERMPGGSMIIGVDLVPIRPIQGVITLQGDITTQECRSAILREMTGWLADVVLHDGSPNIGGNWPREAFDQNCLVLSALKLASSVLKKGGTFVTKAFRSQDYTALIGTFRKLFSKVQATKPAASRSESAEIFVVCMNYQPVKGDAAAELFDPQNVFASTSAVAQSSIVPVRSGEAAAAAVLKERKRLRKTHEGYDDNAAGNLAYGALSVLKFATCNDGTHAKMLADSGSIALDDPRIEEHPLTTAEIKECCRDVRVLGRRELRLLLAWRRKMGKMLSRIGKKKEGKTDDEKASGDEEMTEEAEERRTELQIQALKTAEEHRQKKKLKKAKEAKLAARKRMTAAPEAAKFRSVHDLMLEEEAGQNELFSLKQLRSASDLNAALDDAEAQELASSEEDEGENDEAGLKPRRKTVAYHRDEDREYDDEELVKPKKDDEDEMKKRKKRERKGKKNRKDQGNLDESEEGEEEISGPGECPLSVSCESAAERDKRCLKQWEDTVSGFISGDKKGRKRRDSSSSDDSSDDGKNDFDDELADWELEAMAKINGKQIEKTTSEKKNEPKVKKSKKNKNGSDHSDEDSSDEDDVKPGADIKMEEPDPVALAIGAKLVSSRKSRRDLIESGYNRYSFGAGEVLPAWFVEDEKQNFQPNLPVTHQEVQMYKDRLKALDARPIHKVAEARGRKKRRLMGRIEGARKEAEKLAENEQMTDAEKQAALKRIYRSTRSSMRQENRVQVVIARGRATGKRAMRPPGVRGRYKVVDSRMKKDLRSQKRAEKRNKKGGRR